MHFKNEIETDHVLVTFVNLSRDPFQLTKCTIIVKNNEKLPCTMQGVKHMCSPVDIDTHRKINLDISCLYPKIQRALNALGKEYKDIVS